MRFRNLTLLMVIVGLAVLGAPSVQAQPTVYDVAVQRNRADYMPRLSDMSQRSVSPRKGTTWQNNTIIAAQGFHTTRLDWVYPGTDTAWINDCLNAGL